MNGEGSIIKLPKVTRLKLEMFLEHLIQTKSAAAGLDDTTMVIVTNTADYASVAPSRNRFSCEGGCCDRSENLINPL